MHSESYLGYNYQLWNLREALNAAFFVIREYGDPHVIFMDFIVPKDSNCPFVHFLLLIQGFVLVAAG